MGQLHSYTLELRAMPVGTQQFNYVVDDAFFQQREEGEIRGGNVDVKLEVEHKGDFFDLTFWMEGKIITACDR